MPGTDYRQITDKVLIANTWFEVWIDTRHMEIETINMLPPDQRNFGQPFDLALAAKLMIDGRSLYDTLLDSVCPKVGGV